jgi:hypothetical protein
MQKKLVVVTGYAFLIGGNFYVVMVVQKMMDERPGLSVTILASLWPLFAGLFNKIVAPLLNRLEGHETKAAAAEALLVENFAFQFVNYYGTVLFAALWKRDLARARSLVFSFLVTKQVIKIVVSFLLSRYKGQIERFQERITEAIVAYFFPPVKSNEGKNDDDDDDTKTK